MTFQRIIIPLVLLYAGCGRQPPDQRWINEVELQGNHLLDEDDILDGLGTQETSWWWWTPFTDRQWFDQATLDQDIQRIERFYASRGFFEARVTRHQVRSAEDGEAVNILLQVVEGRPTTIRAITIDGLDGLSPDRRVKVKDGLGIEESQRFDHAKYLKARQILRQRLERSGYAYAKLEGKVRVDREQRTARILMDANTGPHVHFGRASIEGNGPIPADKLHNLVTWDPGDAYDPLQLNRTRARFYQQRVFSSVRLELPKQPTTTADVRIKVNPSKLRELRLGGGAGIEKGRQEVRLSGTLTWRNFLGGLRTLTLRLKPAFVALPTLWDSERTGPAGEGDLRLAQPDILGSGITVFGLVGYELGIHEGYQFHGPRFQTGLEREFFDEMLRMGVSYNLRFIDFFNIDQSVFDASTTNLGLGFVDPYRLAWLEPFIQLDLRDSLVDPRAGFWTEVRLEQGIEQLASEFSYFKVVPDARGYVPLGTKRLILALRAQLGYLRPSGGQDSPVTRRLSLGGPNSHRGFTYRRLSPQVDGVPLGANSAVLLCGDLRLRMFRLAGYWLSLVGFFDAGDAVERWDRLSPSRLHLATGGSLMWQTPVGAIHLALGVRLNRLDDVPENPDPGERIAFHLTIGEAF